MEIKKIATIKTEFDSKFGIPRQSGIAKGAVGTVVFEKDFQDPNFIRGIEGFSHLWLIWEFSENAGAEVHSTVRPPRLGGNERVGVFATRSPYRPNGLGLSNVELKEVKTGKNGPELVVLGADMLNGTPIYDIKPYIPYTDAVPNATAGFTENVNKDLLNVKISDDMLSKIDEGERETLISILKQDPRPAYHNDDKRVYGLTFSHHEVKFNVCGNDLTVVAIE